MAFSEVPVEILDPASSDPVDDECCIAVEFAVDEFGNLTELRWTA